MNLEKCTIFSLHLVLFIVNSNVIKVSDKVKCKTSHTLARTEFRKKLCIMPMQLDDFPFGYVSENNDWCQMIYLKNVNTRDDTGLKCHLPYIERYDLDNWNLCRRLMQNSFDIFNNTKPVECFEIQNAEWTSPGPEYPGKQTSFLSRKM